MIQQLAFCITILIILPIYPLSSARNWISTKLGCNSTCGGVDIPYPFGMKDPYCYLDKWFEIECRETSQDQKPYLKALNLEVTYFYETQGLVYIKNPIFHSNCESKKRKTAVINLRESPFVYSQDWNKFVAFGCNSLAFLQSNGAAVGGCVSICDDNEQVNVGIGDEGCHGTLCCETSLPSYLSEYNATLQDLNNNSSHECSSASIVEQDYYSSGLVVSDLNRMDHVPAVLQWQIWKMLANSTLQLPSGVNCSNLTSTPNTVSSWICRCPIGFGGNPFISEGCSAIPGFYDKNNRVKKWAIVGVFSGLGSVIFLLGLWLLYKVVKKSVTEKRKQKFFKKNGGLLLQQRISSNEVNVEKTILFSLKDLEKATDHFNVNRVLGKGGQGTVYKGMLIDGRIVAVKKLKVEGNVEEFINEFVILSQINNRNVVKLLGCCLETEIPLLVYEFIPNGNLFEYLHEQNEELPMTWDMRLRIATEIAGALFYLHSVASQPIYHRDIKSTNILLDEKYRAKVADFGTSRMISIEATHLTTVVQGTFGYLDPEYFHTSQFTEKSDVYSFGVVLVELLTGQRPISSLRPQEAKSLAPYFLLCMEENRLFDIIDERVVKDGEKEHIIAVANLASRCIELNGKKRPTMKEVTLELEGIRKLERKATTQERHDELELVPIQDYQSWADYSTSNIRSTFHAISRTQILEDIHILTV